MSSFTRLLLSLGIALLVLTSGFQSVQACDRSNVTLDSVRTVGGLNHIYMTLCIGAGRSGSTFGANQPTGWIFSFAIWGPPGIRSSIISWTPTITSDTLHTTYIGDTLGPGYSTESQNIAYFDPGFAANYTCMSTTVPCGRAHTDCQQFHFVFNGMMPDSIRVLGIEGFPTMGDCGGSDMNIAFGGPLPLNQLGASAALSPNGIRLNWELPPAADCREMVILASPDGNSFVDAAVIGGSGIHTWTDVEPKAGLNFYRLQARLADGSSLFSEVLSVNWDAQRLKMAVFPNPAEGMASVQLETQFDEAVEVTLADLPGRSLRVQAWNCSAGMNTLPLDLSALSTGRYLVVIRSRSGIVSTPLDVIR